MNFDNNKIRSKLKIRFKREPSDDEIINAKTDIAIITELLFDEIEEVKKILEKNNIT